MKTDDGEWTGVWKWYAPTDDESVVFEQTYDAGVQTSGKDFYPGGEVRSTKVYSREGRVLDLSYFVRREYDWANGLRGYVTVYADDVPDGTVEIRKIVGSVPLDYEFLDADGNALKKED